MIDFVHFHTQFASDKIVGRNSYRTLAESAERGGRGEGVLYGCRIFCGQILGQYTKPNYKCCLSHSLQL